MPWTWPERGRCTISSLPNCRKVSTTTWSVRTDVAMKLTDPERAMLDGGQGKAKQKAMDLLVRYGEALGAERFVNVTNVAGVPGYYNPVILSYYKVTADDAYDVVYSRFDLDSDEVVEVPRMVVNSCALQGGVDAEG